MCFSFHPRASNRDCTLGTNTIRVLIANFKAATLLLLSTTQFLVIRCFTFLFCTVEAVLNEGRCMLCTSGLFINATQSKRKFSYLVSFYFLLDLFSEPALNFGMA
jgi:hypothetical protein